MNTKKREWLLFALIVLMTCCSKMSLAQANGELRWLRVSSLQTYFSEQGAEFEGGGPVGVFNAGCFFSWPSDYSMYQQVTQRAKAMWVGCKDYYDVKAQKTFSKKVIGIGPRQDIEWQNQIFPVEIKLVGQFEHPTVKVDGVIATHNDLYDKLDEVDGTLVADRMVVIKMHTAIGITITKKIYAFTQQYHDNYYIYDYVFENTGIVDNQGLVYQQTLNDVYFYLQYRYSFHGESVTAFNQGWGIWSSTWGRNTVNDVIGTNPNDPNFKFRAFYCWYGPHSERPIPLQDDWGCPNQNETGVMAAAKYGGAITLHADISGTNTSDDRTQPRTTMYFGGDDQTAQTPQSQYNEINMTQRYAVMSAGHATKTHAEEVGDGAADKWGSDLGGYSSAQGFGPYTLAPGQKIHIVIAEGIAGLSREKNREVGANWLTWFKGNGTPTLVLPNGLTTTNYTEYKKAWVQTGKDSILQTFQRALDNYSSNYTITSPPPPPNEFSVESGGDRIRLKWINNAASTTNFDGYVIYRSKGNVVLPQTLYEKIFECNSSYSSSGGNYIYDDTSAQRGFLYYYYIQTKKSVQSGVPLVSSKFWTITNQPARLLRQAGIKLQEVRVVPNPYDVRARSFQFADPIKKFDRDQIAFYGIPGKCALKIYTERGDLIWQKSHENGSGDDFWDSQTQYGQVVVTGVYILYVEVSENIFATEDVKAKYDTYDDDGRLVYLKGDLTYRKGEQMFHKGESIFRKFVVIR